MSQTAPLPLFFRRIAAVSPSLYPDLRLDRSTGYGFASGAQTVPLGLGEMEVAAQHFPILFAGGEGPVPVGLLGLRENSNLFLGADGTWAAGAYVPAYIRAYPFIVADDPATRTVFPAMDPDARALTSGQGERLFEDGRATTALNDAISFSNVYRDAVLAAGVFGRALQGAGLLEDEEATINFTGGGVARIRGFKVVRQERLAELPDETFLEWRRMGWVAAVYAHLYSIGRWNGLIERAAAAG